MSLSVEVRSVTIISLDVPRSLLFDDKSLVSLEGPIPLSGYTQNAPILWSECDVMLASNDEGFCARSCKYPVRARAEGTMPVVFMFVNPQRSARGLHT